jgi:hypothetical protein
LRTVRHLLVVLAALALPIGSTLFVTAPAMASTVDGFQLISEAATSSCVQQDGSTSGVNIATCAATPGAMESDTSQGWLYPSWDVYEFENGHSGTCLSVTGDDPGVYLNTCEDPGDTAQDWEIEAVDSALGAVVLENAHTHYCLWQSNSSLQQRSDCDVNNVHDLWTTPGVFWS